jgi:hydrogenase expression/formation protein HypC
MCLGVPGRIEAIDDSEPGMTMGKVSFGGITRRVCLACVPEAQIGDYVVVHVGFAISIVDQAEAESTLEFLERIGELDELEIPEPDG